MLLAALSCSLVRVVRLSVEEEKKGAFRAFTLLPNLLIISLLLGVSTQVPPWRRISLVGLFGFPLGPFCYFAILRKRYVPALTRVAYFVGCRVFVSGILA